MAPFVTKIAHECQPYRLSALKNLFYHLVLFNAIQQCFTSHFSYHPGLNTIQLKSEPSTRSYMVISGCMNVINFSCKSMAKMNIINWPEYGADYGLHVFRDPTLESFQTKHTLKSVVRVMETRKTTL